MGAECVRFAHYQTHAAGSAAAKRPGDRPERPGSLSSGLAYLYPRPLRRLGRLYRLPAPAPGGSTGDGTLEIRRRPLRIIRTCLDK